MPETNYVREGDEYLVAAVAASDAGELWQMADGWPARQIKGAASGTNTNVKFQTGQKATVPKATSVVFIDGDEVWWDHSAGNATYKPVNDRDFYLGTAVGDWSSANTFMDVCFGREPIYRCDLARRGFKSVLVGTAAAGGFGYPVNLGGSLIFELSATSEAQKVDALGVDGFAVGSNWIVDGCFRVISDGAGTAVDVSMGVASATHASDADSIAESVFIHLDANNTQINAESDDGTNEVASSNTTAGYTEGSDVANRVYFKLDGRDPSSVKVYVNGAAVLTATTFNVSAATGPLFPLVHVEKTSSTDTYKLAIDFLRVRIAEQ